MECTLAEVIEQGPGSGSGNIRVGDSSAAVSIKVYQDIYHQITGRTEKIRKRYTDNLLIDYSEIEQLHHKIKQLCDVHKVVACNETVSVFHEKDRKEQFTSFDRFSSYNANATSPTVNVVLKYNFSIIPAGLDRPQEYVVTATLISRVAMIQELEADALAFVRGRYFAHITGPTAEISVEYADYVIARGFLEAFSEWVSGCKNSPSQGWLVWLQRWSHHVPRLLKLVTAVSLILIALEASARILVPGAPPDLWARFFIIFGGSFYVAISLVGLAGQFIEEAIDSYGPIAYLKMNKGDAKLIEEFGARKKKVILKGVVGALVAIGVRVAAAKIAAFI